MSEPLTEEEASRRIRRERTRRLAKDQRTYSSRALSALARDERRVAASRLYSMGWMRGVGD